jgi:hypothetical protein
MRKCSSVKARRSISATASASPSAMVSVVEVVGATPTAQASRAAGRISPTSEASISAERGRLATPISGIANRRVWPMTSCNSCDSPEFEITSATSPCVIMPRSPWLASEGCTKKAGVPVEASVAAILRPTWPDLPMPLTTTRPGAARMVSTACAKGASSVCA